MTEEQMTAAWDRAWNAVWYVRRTFDGNYMEAITTAARNAFAAELKSAYRSGLARAVVIVEECNQGGQPYTRAGWEGKVKAALLYEAGT